MTAATNTAEEILRALDAHAALARAWSQVDPDELALTLRAMPTKLRNRVLSAHRTPSSKVSATTARLLVTNVGRGGPRERLRAADAITIPISRALGDAADHSGSLDALISDVTAAADEWGRSIVVLAVVSQMMAEPERFAPVLLAAHAGEILTEELADIVEDVRAPAEARIAAQNAASDAARSREAHDAGSEPENMAALMVRRDAAVVAAQRLLEAIEHGRAPEDAELAEVTAFRDVLHAAATRLGVPAELGAIEAASDAARTRADTLALAGRLAGLSGPDTLAAAIDEVRAAASTAGDDIELAGRLRTFVAILDATQPLDRFGFAGELRSQPAPPDPALVDAALAGLLQLDADGPVEVPTTAAASGEGRAQRRDDRHANNAWRAVAEPDGRNLEAPDATGSTRLRAPAQSDASTLTEVERDDENGRVQPGSADRTDNTADGTGQGTAGRTAEPTFGGEAGRAAEGAAADAEAPTPTKSAVTAPNPTPAVRAPTAASAPAALDIATPAAKLRDDRPGPEAAGHDRTDAAPAWSEPATDEIATTFAALVSQRRFDLAHHLANAVGQDYRAAILAESALAHTLRSASTATAVEMVERAMSQPLNPADVGSIVLRAAAGTRVALLDPASGAPAVLRQIIPALDGLPHLRDLVVAIAGATEQGLSLPATGVTIDAAEALEQARNIATWADEFLHRPPRQNRLYRGVEIWKGFMAADGLLGEILALLASNDPDRVEEVRAACRPIADRRLRNEAVETADRRLRGRRLGGAQRIIGPARAHLLRGMEDVVEQALAWCNLHAAIKGGGHASALREHLATTAIRLRPKLGAELAGVLDDEWSQAAATAAAETIAETIGLLTNEGLDGSDLPIGAALSRSLALIEALELDADLRPRREPTAAEIIVAAHTSRAQAFAGRLLRGDFATAETIIDLAVGPADGFDESEARQRLRTTEREYLERVSKRWSALDARFAAARARGRIGDTDAARLQGTLLQAQPRSAESGDRRDLGRVEKELEELARDLDTATRQRREAVNADVADAIGELSDAWTSRLQELLARDELGAAEEYLHRALAGDAPPEGANASHGPDRSLTTVLTSGRRVDDEVVAAIYDGSSANGLDFSGIGEIDRPSVGAGVAAWQTLRSERSTDLDTALSPVLRLLGIIPTTVERSGELRTASTKGRWFADVLGDKSGYAYVPDFGSRSGGRRRVMICWEELPVAQLWDLAAANAPVDQPVYVLYMGLLGPEARAELARHARRRNGPPVVVVDDAVVLRCALAGEQSYDVTMRALLPYAAPNPYDPDLLAGTPAEMFYGRRTEREKIKSPSGSSFISGGRRLGKTALLRSVQAELEDSDVLALLIVIQHVAAVPPNDPGELWSVLAARLIEASVLDEGAGGTADEVSAGIRTWLGHNPGRRLLLLLDECDFFLRADAASSFANVVRLRDLMQYGAGRFKVVFSGLHHVARYRKLPNQPLSHLPQPLVIGPLDPASAAELVRRPLHALGWDVSDAQVDRLVTFCACNPSVLQLACSQLLERLRAHPVSGLAPWTVPDDVLNELLRSPEVEHGVRDRLFLTLELDHRYKLLAYLLAWRSLNEGLGVAASPTELRRLAVDYWPEGFASQNPDDVRALCDELVGLGVFAGDAEAGYRMLSPATARLFGSGEEISDELIGASELYEADLVAGAAGNRIALSEGRFSPLTAAQIADVVGIGTTQLRVVVGSRALRAESVPEALAVATRELLGARTVELTGTSRRRWQDAMTAPPDGHAVVVSDMTVGRSEESWDQSLDAARRRDAARTARGTRAAVLVAGPADRWLLRRLVTTPRRRGDLADVAVGLRRVDLSSLRAWDRIEELDLAHPARQARLLAVTGGWPMLVERVIARMRQRPFDDAVDELEAHLAGIEGARELLAAVGLDLADADQPADPGLVATFARLVETGWRESLADLAELLALDDDLAEEDPAEAVAILDLLGTLDIDDDGLVGPEPVLAASAQRC